MIDRSFPLEIAYPKARIACDYTSGHAPARRLFASAPEDVERLALERTRQGQAPEALANAVVCYNRSLGAAAEALDAAASLRHRDAVCVITGQQVGFLGGPAYVAYKILTALRHAHALRRTLGIPVVPVFWLATQDHDLGEINRCHYVAADGEVATVRFEWDGAGRPISTLPLTPEALECRDRYLEAATAPTRRPEIARITAPDPKDDYSLWHARIWTRIFSRHGLVIVDPAKLGAFAAPIYARAVAAEREIAAALHRGADAVREAGYEVALPMDRAGRLFTLDADGRRVRLPPTDSGTAPQVRYDTLSPDAALRPVLADTLFPVVLDVLGPGELAYHALLRPVYELFDVPQPAARLRWSGTIVSPEEARLAEQIGEDPETLVASGIDVPQVASRLVSDELRQMFAAARSPIQNAFTQLRPGVCEIDATLDRERDRAARAALRELERLERRAAHAQLEHRGFAPARLQRLGVAIRPRGRLQERVFPFLHFLHRHGPSLVEELLSLDTDAVMQHHWICRGRWDEKR